MYNQYKTQEKIESLILNLQVQSELGDYDSEEHGTCVDYLRDFDFAPCQTDDLLGKIMEIHKTTLRVRTDILSELMLKLRICLSKFTQKNI